MRKGAGNWGPFPEAQWQAMLIVAVQMQQQQRSPVAEFAVAEKHGVGAKDLSPPRILRGRRRSELPLDEIHGPPLFTGGGVPRSATTAP